MCSDHNATCLGQVNEIRLCNVWVVFDLERRDSVFLVCEVVVETLSLKVANANRARDALVDGCFE